MTGKEIALQVEQLTYSYPNQDLPCLTEVNLQILKGEKFGLFGPNGAGKSTLINLMTGLLKIQQGSIHLLDNDVKNYTNELKKNIGFVPQDFSFYPELTAEENLNYFGALYGLGKNEIKQRTNELLDIIGLKNFKNKQVANFSGGMKRRVNLAIGILHKPSVLFLDEPTVGVDIQSKTAIISYLLELNKSGTTLIYTSHQLSEAELLCDKIALIDNGKIIAHNTLQNLLHTYNQSRLEELFISLTGKALRDQYV